MSSKFLSSSSGGGDLTILQNGTFNINIADATINNLLPNTPVKTDETTKKLVSAKITNADLDTTLHQSIEDTIDKTGHIMLPSSSDGTYFNNNIYADKFILYGATSTNKGYLMSDGTTTVNSQVGQPNIYLYTNSNGVPANQPAVGQIRTNNTSNTLTSHIYISESTRDGTNIEVFLNQISDISIIYIQDQNASTNWIRYTVSSATMYSTYLDVTVAYLSSSGLGGADFGGNQPIFLSIFDNSFLIANRITTLEAKTQNQTMSGMTTTFNDNLIVSNGLSASTAPVIGPIINTKFEVSDLIKAYIPLDLGNQNIYNGGLYNGHDIDALSNQVSLNVSNINSKLSKTTADGLYAPLTGADYLTAANAALTYLSKTTAGNTYALLSSLGNYLTTSSATNLYLDKTTAGNTYVLLSSLGNYLTISAASTTYLDKTTASNTYALLSSLGNYLTTSSANTTYLDKTTASNTYALLSSLGNYLTISSASTLYLSKTDAVNTFLSKIDAAAKDTSNKQYVDTSISNLNIGNYLLKTTAVQTYASLVNLNTVNDAVNTKLSLSGGLLNGNLTLQTGNLSIQNGSLSMNGNDMFNVGLIAINSGISILSGNSTSFMKTDGSSDNKIYLTQDDAKITYVGKTALTNSAVAYINPSGQLSSSSSNLYVQKGVNTIQSALDAVVNNTYASIQLSSGVFVENIVLSKMYYTLSGLSSRISGNMTVGLAGISTDNISVKDIVVLGNLTFITDTNYHNLKHYFSGCEFKGSITFPTATNFSGYSITFEDCIFSGSSAITFNNIGNDIIFTRCVFNGQVITNNQTLSSRLIFRECRNLSTLSLGNCLKYGLNQSVSASSLTVDSTNSALLRADGTQDTNTYPTLTSGTTSVTWTGGTGGTTQTQNIEWRKMTDGTISTVWLRFSLVTITIGTSNAIQVGLTAANFPSSLCPPAGTYLAISTIFGGVTQVGYLVVYPNNALGIVRGDRASIPAGTTNCGTGTVNSVSYMM